MLSALSKSISSLAAGVTSSSSADSGDTGNTEADALPVTNGKRVEVWVETAEPLQNKLVTRFAANMPMRHAQGQWLVCDWQIHEMSKNPTFTGFQKIYRKKYKPTQFKQEAVVILNADDGTNSDPQVWAHVQKILNEYARRDVAVEEREAKSMRNRK